MRITAFLLLSISLLLGNREAKAQIATDTARARSSLAAGDVIRLVVWREPDLSGEFIVNENGIVTLPLLGRVNVSAIPSSQLSDSLISAYSLQLRNTSVTVTALRRIYVLGEVMKPGLYPTDPTMILAGVLALAGGATPTGDLGRIRVVRNGATVNARLSTNAVLEMTDIRSGDQIFVDRRSWLSMNSGLVASATISSVALLLTLFIRAR
jgi:protein involved in polysaccharide export with SLBB domain